MQVCNLKSRLWGFAPAKAFALLFAASFAAQGATIAFQDFESVGTWGFTASPTQYASSAGTVFGTGSSQAWKPVTAFTGNITSGSGGSATFWGAKNLNSGNHTLTFDSVDVSTYATLQVSFDYNFSQVDANDFFEYRLVVDGIAAPTWTSLKPATGNNISSGGWVNVTNSFASASTLGLQIRINQTGNNDFIGLDAFSITGEPTGPVGSVPEPSSIALFGLGLAGFGLVRRKRKA